MYPYKERQVRVEGTRIVSACLQREVRCDVYLPPVLDPASVSLLLINDGQDLPKMHFAQLLQHLSDAHLIQPLVCAGIYAGNRLQEYGTAGVPDYEGRGARAQSYTQFVLHELLPFLHVHYGVEAYCNKGFAGFSLGGLSALDIAWRHPQVFSVAGVFSGSLWWRTRALNDGYCEDRDRIMHALVRKGPYHPGQRFYFTTGSLDETADRNNNGIIDSIDDTLGLIKELKKKGYNTDYDIKYINYEDGRHDVETWGRAMPQFLLWGWGRK